MFLGPVLRLTRVISFTLVPVLSVVRLTTSASLVLDLVPSFGVVLLVVSASLVLDMVIRNTSWPFWVVSSQAHVVLSHKCLQKSVLLMVWVAME